MKSFKWIGITMLAVLVVLAGCNTEEPVEDNAVEEEAENQAEQDNTEEQIQESAEPGSDEESQENEKLIDLAGAFIDQLNEGNYEEATENFDETMAEQVTAADLEEIWVSLNDQLGNFVDYEYNTTDEADGYQIILLTGIFNDADVNFQVTFDESEKIAGFFVQ